MLVVLAAAVLLVRLARGPLSLDFATPWIVDALQPEDGSFRVTIGATELVWTDRWYDVDLTARDVAFRDPGGAPLATFPTLAMELSVTALLHGELAPREIELVGPDLRLLREPDGSIGLGLGRNTREGGGSSILQRLVSGAEDDEGTSPAAEWLRSIVVRDGQLALTDRASGFEGSARDVQIDLRREQVGLMIELAAALAFGGERIPVRLRVAQADPPAETRVEISFDDVDPAALVQATSALVPEAGSAAAALADGAARVRMPLDGKLDLTLVGMKPRVLAVDVTGARGTVDLPPPLSQQLPIERMALGAELDVATGVTTLRVLQVDLGTPEVHASGTWNGGAGDGALRVEVTVATLPVDALAGYWPAVAAPDARTWVTGNISAGLVRSATVALRGTLAVGDATRFTLGGLDGRVAFDGLTVRYVDTMPPATGVKGSATFSPDAWRFAVEAATVAGLSVPAAQVHITGIGARVSRISIDAQAKGSLRDALLLVDHEPLRYARTTGIDPQTVSGALTGRVKLAFPISGAPIPPDLGVSVQATLRDAALPRAVGDWDMTNGALQLAVGGETLNLSGSARVAGVPCEVAWNERLGATSGVVRTVDVTSTVDADGRAALGFDLRPWLTGPVGVTAHVEQRHGGEGTAQVRADLAPAVIALPEMRVDKAAGAPGEATGTLRLAGARVTAVDPFRFAAAGADAHGRATLREGGQLGEVSLAGELAPAKPGGERPDFSLRLDPAPGRNKFDLTSEDASTLLRVLLPESRTVGGQLHFSGDLAQRPAGWAIDGNLDVRSFTLTESPMLARLATLASLSGIVSALRNTGIAFDSFTTGLAYDAGALTFRDAVVSGPSLRLVVDGTIDGPKDSVAMTGTLIPPIYGLNTLPGKIPIIGGLFRDKDGEGLIGIDFTVQGKVKDPSVSVKPLQSLAPGVLKTLMRKVPSPW